MQASGSPSAPGWLRSLPRVAAVLAAGAFASWEGLQGRFSTASHAGILGAIAAGVAVTVVAGRGRQRTRSGTWARGAARSLRNLLSVTGVTGVTGVRGRAVAVAGALVWVVLIAATVGWDATSFVEQRHDLPTLSRLFGDVTDHDWGRALLFAAWLVLGWYLATGWRRPVRRTGPGPGDDEVGRA